jgi:hypothetical protein
MKERFLMKAVLRLLAFVLMASPVRAADPPGFAIWKAADLKQHDEALPEHVAEDH